MGNVTYKMDLDTILIFGGGSYLAQKVLKKIKSKQKICISKSIKNKKNNRRGIKIFKDYLGDNQKKINKLITGKKVTVIFFNNYIKDNLILNKSNNELRTELEENLLNTFENAKNVSKQLLKNNIGRLIFINSSRALTSDVGISGYSITKNGIMGIMKTFSKEFSRFNITSNCLSLGFFDSPLYRKVKKNIKKKLLARCDIDKPGDINSIVNAITFITNSKYFTGSTLFLDGGFK